MERKKFLKDFAIGGSLLFASPMLFNACGKASEFSEIILDLNDPENAELKNIEGFVYKNDVIIIRTGANDYTALSAICTHQGCIVSYNASTNELPCPCHGSKYNLSGKVLNGPAQANLEQYMVNVEGNILRIS